VVSSGHEPEGAVHALNLGPAPAKSTVQMHRLNPFGSAAKASSAMI